MNPPVVDVRRGSDRAVTSTDWLTSRHSFSFGAHYEPDNLRFGALLSHNEDTVAAGAGFEPHPHRAIEIVTWVLEGTLVHEDSAARRGIVLPGVVQRLSAGAGVVHSERNASTTEALRLVQMWIEPDTDGPVDYARADVTGALRAGGLVTVVSGRPGADAPLAIRRSGAELAVARIGAGEAITVPPAHRAHVFLARGAVDLGGTALAAGDAVRLSGAGALAARAHVPSEVLVWSFD